MSTPRVSCPSPNRLIIDGDPNEIADFVANCQCDGIHVHVENVPPRTTNGASSGTPKKPVPLGLGPVLNFRKDPDRSKKQAAVQNRRSDGKPTPLGVPTMVFNRNRD